MSTKTVEKRCSEEWLSGIPEAMGIGGDVANDQLKIGLGLVPPNDTICGEGHNINMFPQQFFHGGPAIHSAPGVRKNVGIDFEW